MNHRDDPPRLLTPEELADLRREMLASSRWMRGELKRLCEAGCTAHAALAGDAIQALDDVRAGRVCEADDLLARIQRERGADHG